MMGKGIYSFGREQQQWNTGHMQQNGLTSACQQALTEPSPMKVCWVRINSDKIRGCQRMTKQQPWFISFQLWFLWAKQACLKLPSHDGIPNMILDVA